MAARIKDQQRQNSTSPNKSTSTRSLFMARLASQRTTWVFLSIIVCTILFSSSWNILKSILSWYSSTTNSTSFIVSSWWPPALYASVALGAVLGLLSMAAAVVVVVQATLEMWTLLSLLTLCGMPWRKLTAKEWLILVGLAMKILIKEWLRLVGLAVKILIKEGLVALCAVLGNFALVRRSKEDVGAS